MNNQRYTDNEMLLDMAMRASDTANTEMIRMSELIASQEREIVRLSEKLAAQRKYGDEADKDVMRLQSKLTASADEIAGLQTALAYCQTQREASGNAYLKASDEADQCQRNAFEMQAERDKWRAEAKTQFNLYDKRDSTPTSDNLSQVIDGLRAERDSLVDKNRDLREKLTVTIEQRDTNARNYESADARGTLLERMCEDLRAKLTECEKHRSNLLDDLKGSNDTNAKLFRERDAATARVKELEAIANWLDENCPPYTSVARKALTKEAKP